MRDTNITYAEFRFIGISRWFNLLAKHADDARIIDLQNADNKLPTSCQYIQWIIYFYFALESPYEPSPGQQIPSKWSEISFGDSDTNNLGSQDIGDEFAAHAKITMRLTTVASFSSIDYEHCGCVCDRAELMDQGMQYPACWRRHR